MKNSLFVFFIFIFACGPGPDPIFVEQKTDLYFYIVDKNTKESIINHFKGPFYPESTILDEEGKIPRFRINTDGEIEFEITDRQKDSLNIPLRKTYYLNLIGKSNQVEDVDTLTFQFVSTYSTKKDPEGIEDFSCYYNDSLYTFKSFPGLGTGLKFYKK